MAQLLGDGRELVDDVLDVLQGLLGPWRPSQPVAVASGAVEAAGVILPWRARRVGVLDAGAGIHAGGLLEGKCRVAGKHQRGSTQFLMK
jgi:hypothetical protein